MLAGAGATLLLAAEGGVWRADAQGLFDIGKGPAYAPWSDWRGEGVRGPLALVPAAMLAANAHNTQPWRFQIEGTRIDLFADRTRGIGTVDPDAREMHISLGCALENLHLAARANGYDDRIALAPDAADPSRVAMIGLLPGAEDVSPLYASIPHRHTNRYDFDIDRSLPPSTLDALDDLADDPATRIFWFITADERERIGRLLVASAAAIDADHEQAADNGERWLRVDRDDIERHRDGLTPNAMGLSQIDLIAAKLFPALARHGAGGGFAAMERRWAATAGAFGIIAVTDGRDRSQRLQAGRLWQRMHLWLTRTGLAAQPMNQLHERADREAQLGITPTFGDAVRELVGDSSWDGIFTFRLGWPTRPAPASPRRAVVDVVEGDPAD
jgi:hypothetical protein